MQSVFSPQPSLAILNKATALAQSMCREVTLLIYLLYTGGLDPTIILLIRVYIVPPINGKPL